MQATIDNIKQQTIMEYIIGPISRETGMETNTETDMEMDIVTEMEMEKDKKNETERGKVWYGMVWYGMVFICSTSLYIIYIAHHYNITQDAEREMHEVQYLYVAFP